MGQSEVDSSLPAYTRETGVVVMSRDLVVMSRDMAVMSRDMSIVVVVRVTW